MYTPKTFNFLPVIVCSLYIGMLYMLCKFCVCYKKPKDEVFVSF